MTHNFIDLIAKPGAQDEPAVRALQEALDELGYPEPRFGVDGDLGQQTLGLVGRAVSELLGYDGDTTPNNTVPGIVAHALVNLAAARRWLSLADPQEQPPRAAAADTGGIDRFPLVQDFRSESWDGKERRKNPIARVDTICLHQMAVASVRAKRYENTPIPESLAHLGDHSGPVYVPNETGKIKRWRKLSIHFAITCGPESRAWLMHDLLWRLPHGHGWNRRSVGLEFEGYFAGIHDLGSGKHSKFWRPKSRPDRLPMVPTEAQLEAGRQCCRFIIGDIARLGGRIKYVGAHRQSYGVKASDPGALIWQGVAVPILNEFGLEVAPVLKHPKHPGRDIPAQWDPQRRPEVSY